MNFLSNSTEPKLLFPAGKSCYVERDETSWRAKQLNVPDVLDPTVRWQIKPLIPAASELGRPYDSRQPQGDKYVMFHY